MIMILKIPLIESRVTDTPLTETTLPGCNFSQLFKKQTKSISNLIPLGVAISLFAKQ